MNAKGGYVSTIFTAAIVLANGYAAHADDLEEVVVTAQKRTQNLREVGMDVAVLSGSALRERRILGVEELANSVLGLSFTKSNTTVPVYSLRGVGFYDNGINAYPTVTVYIDEVPLPFSAMTGQAAMDLERLEVLKGPQGTLFGSNATGGALNYIAAKPTDILAAGVSIGYGRFNEISADGYVSGPISETLKARLAFKSIDADAWQKDYDSGAETGRTDIKAARLMLDWEPFDTLRAQVMVNAWQDKSDPQAAQYFQYSAQQPGTPIPLATTPPTRQEPRAAGFTPNLRVNSQNPTEVSEPFGDSQLVHNSLRFDLDVTDSLTATSLTSYADYEFDMALDRDGTSYRDFDLPVGKGHINDFSQELRLANASSSSTRWLIGGNYSKDNVYENYTMDWPDSTTRVFFDPPFKGRSGYYTDQNKENWAVFTNIEQDLSNFTLKAGARYTESRLYAIGCNYDVAGYGIADFFTGLSQITRTVLGLAPSPLSQVQPNACSLIDLVGILGRPATGLPLPDESRLKENNVSWRMGLDWKANDDVLIYGNIAKGFKAGSVPGVPSTFNEQTKPVTEESVLAYEVGLKASLLDRRLQLDTAAFYYDYKDKQLRTRYVNPVFGLLDLLDNIPKSRIEGIELSAVYRPINNLMLYSNLLWLEGEITKGPPNSINAEGTPIDFAGEDMPYAPQKQAAIGGQIEWPMGSLDYFFAADLNYRSKTTAIIGGSSVYDIGSYGLLDVRAGIKGGDGKWGVTAWGKNLGDRYYWNNVSQVFDTITRYAGKPATYGVTINYEFK